jgi:putative NADH-flavin reductase
MSSIALLGATGNLGQHVARQALTRGWDLSVAVRSRSRLAPEIASGAQVTDLDLSTASVEDLAAFADGHDAFVSCAGVVTQGEAFVRLFDQVVSALETLRPDRRPVCWFIAGAALLPLDATGRQGVDLPKVRDTYWPHRQNFERLQRSDLDWRLLCPGPMVDQPALGLERLRVAIDSLPAALPAMARSLPAPLLLPLFAMKIAEMIIPYPDAAAWILANLQRGSPMSRRRIGVALPAGMKGKKDHWAAKPRDAAGSA